MLLLEARDWVAILEEVQYISPLVLLEGCPVIKGFYEDNNHAHHDDAADHHEQPDHNRRCHKTTGRSHKMLYGSSLGEPCTNTGCCGGARLNFFHQACGLSSSGGVVPSYVLKAICQANPHVLYSTEATYQRNALHIACLKGVDFTIVAALLEIEEKNRRPHHLAEEHDHCHDNKSNNKNTLAKTPDVFGRLPIHYAAMDRSGNGEKVLRLLLKSAPSSLLVQDIHGYSPLHVACKMGQPMNMMRLFLLTAPDSIVLLSHQKEDAAHFARQCIPGVWTAKEQVAIVDYLQNVAFVTKTSIARLGSCHCSYLGKEEINEDDPATRKLQPEGEVRKNDFMVLAKNHQDGLPRLPKGALAREKCPFSFSSKLTENEHFISLIHSGETCSEVPDSERVSITVQDDAGGEHDTSFDCPRFQQHRDLSPCHVGSSAA